MWSLLGAPAWILLVSLTCQREPGMERAAADRLHMGRTPPAHPQWTAGRAAAYLQVGARTCQPDDRNRASCVIVQR